MVQSCPSAGAGGDCPAGDQDEESLTSRTEDDSSGPDSARLPPPREKRLVLKSCGSAIICIALLACGGECAARLDDWIRSGVPLTATPSVERDLRLQDEGVTRGRPHGRYYAARLNAFGFRGPEHSRTPAPGVRRIMCLGASETFGGVESSGDEYPAELRELLRKDGRNEVLNVAIAGMSLSAMHGYWDHWLKQFQPGVVILYPTPFFFLVDHDAQKPAIVSQTPPPVRNRPAKRNPAARISLADSRFLQRLRNVIVLPDFVSERRAHSAIAEAVARRGNRPLWDPVPDERLTAFMTTLDQLIRRIEGDGVQVILLTHPVSAANPPRPEDHPHLLYARVLRPHVSERGLVSFEDVAQQAVRKYARDRDLVLIDLAADMNGRREYFRDLVHFNDAGARRAAVLVHAQLPPAPAGPDQE